MERHTEDYNFGPYDYGYGDGPGDYGYGGGPDDYSYGGVVVDGRGCGEEARGQESSTKPFDRWHHRMGDIIRAYDLTEDLESLAEAPALVTCGCLVLPVASTVVVYGMTGRYKITARVCKRHLMDTYFECRLFPVTITRVRTAVSIPLLRHLQGLRKVSAIGPYGLAEALEDIWRDKNPGFTLGTYFRRQLMNAAVWIQSARAYASGNALYADKSWLRERPSLYTDDLELSIDDLAQSCPACFKHFIGSAASPSYLHDGPEIVVSVDGNFSQKRKQRSNLADQQPLPPRRFLSRRQVDEAERKLGTRNLDRTSGVHDCSASVKAADELAPKGAAGIFDVTGVMGLCCRHDHPLIFCDITSPGERHHYAVALVLALLKTLGQTVKHVGVMYDIGCRFARNDRISALIPSSVKITWTIPLFHVYGHTATCKALYSPRRCWGMSWCDGEGMERVWSAISNLVTSTRSMSQVNRRFHLEERLEHLCRTRQETLQKRMRSKLEDMELVAADCLKRLAEDDAGEAVLASKVPMARTYTSPHISSNDTLGLTKARWNQLSYMAEERRRQAKMTAGFGASSIRTRLATARQSHEDDSESDTPSSDSGSGLSGSDDEDEETAILADKLFRTLSNYLGSLKELETRIKQSNSTDLVARIRESIRTDKASASKAHKALQAHLTKTVPGHKVIADEDIYCEEIRHWASVVATSGTSVDLPWWSEWSTETIIDAFHRLVRISEEKKRIKIEMEAMRIWVDDTLALVRDMQHSTGSTRSGRQMIGLLAALEQKWFITITHDAGKRDAPPDAESRSDEDAEPPDEDEALVFGDDDDDGEQM
ncbi:hypothetical protein V8E36_008385 [Tilletia maclaganii]